ncbi:MAG TPA: glycosyltransferase family 9 protein [bacterium]|nr:glycosyltransferase family 9 protein [bacterium]
MTLPPDFVPRRVLVLRPRGLGDVVLSTAVVDALKRAWPAVPVDYLSERPSGDLLRGDDRLDRIFLLGPGPDDDGRVTGGGTMDAVRWIRAGRPDLVLDLFSNPKTALLTALSGARYRAGLNKRPRRLAYNLRVPRFRGRPEDDHRYAQDVQLDFLRAAGVRWPGEARARIALADEERAFAADVLRDLGYSPDARFGAVLPGGSWESKRWSVAGYAATAADVARRLGRPTLVLWGPPERDDARAIAAELGDSGRLAPPTSLRQMAAVLAGASILISPDCLGRHFGVVLGVPTVGVFGSTDPRDWTPREGPHRTVRGGPDEGFASLRDLPAEPVIVAARNLLDEVDARQGPA